MVLLVADGTDNDVYYYTDAGTYTDKFDITANTGDDYLLFVWDDKLFVVKTDASFTVADADAYSLTSGSIGDRVAASDINFTGGATTTRAKGLAVSGNTLWVRTHSRLWSYSLSTGAANTAANSNFAVEAFGASNVNSDAAGLAITSDYFYLGDTTTGTGVTDGPAIRAYHASGNNIGQRATSEDIILPTAVRPSGLAIVGNDQQLAVCDASTTERILLYDL